jgi:hypothetical protein
MLTKIFVFREVGGGGGKVPIRWKKFNSEELHNLYSPGNTIKVINSRSIGGTCSAYGKDKKFIQTFGERPEREEITW